MSENEEEKKITKEIKEKKSSCSTCRKLQNWRKNLFLVPWRNWKTVN